MDKSVIVRIFGVPVACASGVTEAWRNVADQVRARLTARFGGRVTVEYYDLFSPEMEKFPEVLAQVKSGAAVPLVYVDGELLSSGGKISVPAIAARVSREEGRLT